MRKVKNADNRQRFLELIYNSLIIIKFKQDIASVVTVTEP